MSGYAAIEHIIAEGLGDAGAERFRVGLEVAALVIDIAEVLDAGCRGGSAGRNRTHPARGSGIATRAGNTVGPGFAGHIALIFVTGGVPVDGRTAGIRHLLQWPLG